MQILKKAGFFLIFTLLLTSLITVSSLVMVNVAQINKQSSEYDIIAHKLLQQANQNILAIAQTLDGSEINGITKHLNDNMANVFLANATSSGTMDVVCNVVTGSPYACSANTSTVNTSSIDNLNNYMFGENNKIKINPQNTTDNYIQADSGFVVAGSDLKQIKYNNTNNSPIASYTLTIGNKVCNNSNDCQQTNRDYVFTRTCPNSGTSINGKPLRALTDLEIKSLNREGVYNNNNSFPNLYCTCVSSGYTETTPSGTCCDPGTYWDGTGCAPCDPSCATCYQTATNCTSCKTNCYISGSVCLAPTGYYMNSSGSCDLCSAPCATCINSDTNCTSCLGQRGLSNHNCLSCGSPNSNYFINNILPCESCDPICATCNITGPADYCLSCKSGCDLVEATCIAPAGRYLYDTSDFSCPLCNSNCLTCSGSSTHCDSCRSDRYFKNNSCLNCPEHATCDGSNFFSCAAGFMRNGDVCVECPNGTYSTGGATFCTNSTVVFFCENYFKTKDGCRNCISGTATFDSFASKFIYDILNPGHPYPERCVLCGESNSLGVTTHTYSTAPDTLYCKNNTSNCRTDGFSTIADRCTGCQNTALLEQDRQYLYLGDGKCYSCPRGRWPSRCQCPRGDESVYSDIWRPKRLLENRDPNDQDYWNNNCPSYN